MEKIYIYTYTHPFPCRWTHVGSVFLLLQTVISGTVYACRWTSGSGAAVSGNEQIITRRNVTVHVVLSYESMSTPMLGILSVKETNKSRCIGLQMVSHVVGICFFLAE